MPFSIPNEHREILQRLAALTEENRKALVAALDIEHPTASLNELHDELLPRVPFDRDEASGMLSVLLSLYAVREHYRLSTDELITELISSVPQLRPDTDDVVSFLRELLSFDRTIGVAAKANEVLTAHANPFSTARIISDLRPIFASQSASEISAFVIVHNLQISLAPTAPGEEEKQVFFALDTSDLRMLQKVVSRALTKEESLRRFAERSGITYLALEESD